MNQLTLDCNKILFMTCDRQGFNLWQWDSLWSKSQSQIPTTLVSSKLEYKKPLGIQYKRFTGVASCLSDWAGINVWLGVTQSKRKVKGSSKSKEKIVLILNHAKLQIFVYIYLFMLLVKALVIWMRTASRRKMWKKRG